MPTFGAMRNEIQISTNYMFVARFITTVFCLETPKRLEARYLCSSVCVYSSAAQRKTQDEKNAIWILESRDREREKPRSLHESREKRHLHRTNRNKENTHRASRRLPATN